MKNFIASIVLSKNKVKIKLKIKNAAINTNDLPNTIAVLKKQLPTIFSNKCFNEDEQSFYDEVQCTQVGHLFEHLILENMCLDKIRYQSNAKYNGRTFWDAQNDNGEYDIIIKCNLVDWPIFYSALDKSSVLMDQIYFSQPESGPSLVSRSLD